MDLKKTLATKEMQQHSHLQLPPPTSDMLASEPQITMNVCTMAILMKMTTNTALQPPMMNTNTLQSKPMASTTTPLTTTPPLNHQVYMILAP
jgi:hypothetical protein